MKTLKTATIATIITALIIALCGATMTASAEINTYEVEAVVTEIHLAFADVWEVTAVTRDGNEFGWFADHEDGEYWHIGDVVMLTMWDTGAEEEDEVMDVVLLGTLTPVGVARWMKW